MAYGGLSTKNRGFTNINRSVINEKMILFIGPAGYSTKARLPPNPARHEGHGANSFQPQSRGWSRRPWCMQASCSSPAPNRSHQLCPSSLLRSFLRLNRAIAQSRGSELEPARPLASPAWSPCSWYPRSHMPNCCRWERLCRRWLATSQVSHHWFRQMASDREENLGAAQVSSFGQGGSMSHVHANNVQPAMAFAVSKATAAEWGLPRRYAENTTRRRQT